MGRRSITVTLRNELGLHLRPAGVLQRVAARYTSSVTVTRVDNGVSADGKALLSLIQLAAEPGTELTIEAEGDDAGDALAALAALVEAHFLEPP